MNSRAYGFTISERLTITTDRWRKMADILDTSDGYGAKLSCSLLNSGVDSGGNDVTFAGRTPSIRLPPCRAKRIEYVREHPSG